MNLSSPYVALTTLRNIRFPQLWYPVRCRLSQLWRDPRPDQVGLSRPPFPTAPRSEMSSDAPVTFIKKRKGAPAGLRKKPTLGGDDHASSSSSSQPATSEVIHATKRAVASHLIQGTGNKRRKTQQDAAGDLSDSGDDAGDDGKKDSFAVRHSTERRAQRRRSESPPAWMSSEQVKELKRDKNAAPEEEIAEDGLYHGSSKQRNQVPKAAGPVKAGPTNVRQITVVDYQPDVCKDYKGASPGLAALRLGHCC